MGVRQESENIYEKLVRDNEIDDAGDLSRFAQMRVSSLNSKSSTAIATMIGYLAIFLTAHISALQVAREVNSLQLGLALTAIFAAAFLFGIKVMAKHARALSPEETLVEFKKYLKAKKMLEGRHHQVTGKESI